MKLFDVGENVELGWPVSADVKRRRLFLNLGRNTTNHTAFAHLRFGSSLTQVMFDSSLPPRREDLEDLFIMYGSLAKDDKGVCLVRQRREDPRALVRAGIAPGVGGSVQYVFGDGVDVVAEGALGEEGEDRFPIYVLQVNEGASFEVHRSGDLDGLPARMVFTWDGTTLQLSAA